MTVQAQRPLRTARHPCGMRHLPWMFIALLACKDEGRPIVVDTGADEGLAPYDCGELPDLPDLPAGVWAPSSQAPAGGLISIVDDQETGALYAGSHDAGLYKSTDGGQSWDWMHTAITHTLADLYVPSGLAGVLFRSSGGWLEKSEDGGESWRQASVGELDPEQPAQLVLAIAGAGHDGDRVYLATSDGTSWVSTDAGEGFEEVGDIGVMGDPDDMNYLRYMGWRLLGEGAEGDAVLFADRTTVFVSWDGLQNWEAVLSGSIAAGTLARNPQDGDHVVVASTTGEVHVSRDGGASWSSTTTGASLRSGAFAADGTELYLSGDEVFLVSGDGGETFSEREAPLRTPLVTHATSAQIFVGDEGGLRATVDEGSTWTDADAGMDDVGISVIVPHPVCANRVLLGSRCSGGIFSSTDWGDAWAQTSGNFHYVMGVHHDPRDPDRAWAVSDDALYLSEDGGQSWEIRHVEYHYHGFAIHPDDGDVLLMGSVGSGEYADSAGRVYKSEDAGRTWRDVSEGIPHNDASMHTMVHWPDDPDVVIMGTYKGGDVSHQDGNGIGLFRSEDAGESWALVDLDVTDVAWVTEGPGGSVVAATDDGLWQTTDAGLSWTRLEGPEGFLLSADFDGELGFAMNRDGQVWQTTDGGVSWTENAPDAWWDPTTWLATIAVTPAHPETGQRMVWMSIYNTGVYRMLLE